MNPDYGNLGNILRTTQSFTFIFSFVHGGIGKRSLSKRDDFCQNVKCPWSWRAVCGSDGVTYKVGFILRVRERSIN